MTTIITAVCISVSISLGYFFGVVGVAAMQGVLLGMLITHYAQAARGQR